VERTARFILNYLMKVLTQELWFNLDAGSFEAGRPLPHDSMMETCFDQSRREFLLAKFQIKQYSTIIIQPTTSFLDLDLDLEGGELA